MSQIIGLLGGMSWESTAQYYAELNRGVQQRSRGQDAASILLHSFNFAEIKAMQSAGDWSTLAKRLSQAARSLEAAGAQAILICANTMHKVADAVQSEISIPLLHLADVTAAAVLKHGFTSAGLLGTRYTMEEDFYLKRLQTQGLKICVPHPAERKTVHDIIYQELVQGVFEPHSRQQYLEIMRNLQASGAEAIILGCTEIGLLIKSTDTDIPLFDTTHLHVQAALDFICT